MVQRNHDRGSMHWHRLHLVIIPFYRAILVVLFHHRMRVHRAIPRRSCTKPAALKRMHRRPSLGHRPRIRKPSVDTAKRITCLNVSTHVRFLSFETLEDVSLILAHSMYDESGAIFCPVLKKCHCATCIRATNPNSLRDDESDDDDNHIRLPPLFHQWNRVHGPAQSGNACRTNNNNFWETPLRSTVHSPPNKLKLFITF